MFFFSFFLSIRLSSLLSILASVQFDNNKKWCNLYLCIFILRSANVFSCRPHHFYAYIFFFFPSMLFSSTQSSDPTHHMPYSWFILLVLNCRKEWNRKEPTTIPSSMDRLIKGINIRLIHEQQQSTSAMTPMVAGIWQCRKLYVALQTMGIQCKQGWRWS